MTKRTTTTIFLQASGIMISSVKRIKMNINTEITKKVKKYLYTNFRKSLTIRDKNDNRNINIIVIIYFLLM